MFMACNRTHIIIIIIITVIQSLPPEQQLIISIYIFLYFSDPSATDSHSRMSPCLLLLLINNTPHRSFMNSYIFFCNSYFKRSAPVIHLLRSACIKLNTEFLHYPFRFKFLCINNHNDYNIYHL